MATSTMASSTAPARTANHSMQVGQPGYGSTLQSSEGWTMRWATMSTSIQSGMSKCWARVRALGSTSRQKCSLSAWLGIAASVVIGALGLRYAYVQQMLAYEAMKLAQWTARKDFRELCQEQSQMAQLSPKCDAIIREPFPEPPYVNLERWKRQWQQNTSLYSHHAYPLDQRDPGNHSHLQFRPWNFILVFGFVVFWCRRPLRRLYAANVSTHTHSLVEAYPSQHRLNHSIDRERPMLPAPGSTSLTTGTDATSRRGLRRRHNNTKPNTIWKAAEEGDLEEVEHRLDNGVDVNIHSKSDGSPLSAASRHGQFNTVKLLLSRGANPCRKNDWYKENALQAAAEGGYEDIVQILLDHGADINAEICGLRAICAAAWRNHSSVVRLLVSRGAQEDLIKGPSTNGIRLSAHHASRVLIRGGLKFDLDWVPDLFVRLGSGRYWDPLSKNAEISDKSFFHSPIKVNGLAYAKKRIKSSRTFKLASEFEAMIMAAYLDILDGVHLETRFNARGGQSHAGIHTEKTGAVTYPMK